MRWLVIFSVLCSYPQLMGQTLVTGKSTVLVDQTISYVDAKMLAVQQAKTNALESLGVNVSRRSTRSLNNSDGSSSTSYSSISTLTTSGVWIQTADGYPRFNEIGDFIECEIKGYAMSYQSSSTFCDLSFGKDSMTVVFKDSEAIHINATSETKGYSYLLANKVGSNEASILHYPQSSVDLEYGFKSPVEIAITLDDRRNLYEEYRFYFLHVQEPIDFGRVEGYDGRVPQGWSAPEVISTKTLDRVLMKIAKDSECCIEEEALIVIQ